MSALRQIDNRRWGPWMNREGYVIPDANVLIWFVTKDGRSDIGHADAQEWFNTWDDDYVIKWRTQVPGTLENPTRQPKERHPSVKEEAQQAALEENPLYGLF